MSRNIHEAAARLKDATPEEIQLIAKHDWDMIRDVAAFAIALGSPPAAPSEDEVERALESCLEHFKQNRHIILSAADDPGNLSDEEQLQVEDANNHIGLIKAALAALPRPAVSGWRTMESAPRDGTLLDLMFPEPRGRTTNCSWNRNLGGWVFYTPHWPDGLDGKVELQAPNMQPFAWMYSPASPTAPGVK